MGTLITWMIVIPLFCYVATFWGRLMRAGALRVAKLAAEYRPERESGHDRGGEYEWPGEP